MVNHLVSACKSKVAWPSVIAAIFVAIILSSIAFSQLIIESKAWMFMIVLFVGIFWSLLIYWFCYTGFQSFGWFFLLLPAASYIIWKLSYILARATTSPHCVFGDT
jgi:hypothetical protein